MEPPRDDDAKVASLGRLISFPRFSLLVALALFLALPEIVLGGTSLGLWGSQLWRPTVLHYGGFWPGLLRNWQPNYTLQPAAMFVTYAFLHAGPVHLLGNLGGLLVLGPRILDTAGGGGFLLIWSISTISGAITYGMAPLGFSPMVGASGAIFGLAGALVVMGWRERVRALLRGRALVAPAAGFILVLVLVNVLGWLERDGLLAWQAHLGGALGGMAVELVRGRRRGTREAERH